SSAMDSQAHESFSISPGFYKKGEAKPRLARVPDRWVRSVEAMKNSGAPWQLVTTFNEWGEGTAVESAKQWASYTTMGGYLDVLHRILVGRGAPPPPTTTTPTTGPRTTTTRPQPTTTTIGGTPGNIRHIVVITEENRT